MPSGRPGTWNCCARALPIVYGTPTARGLRVADGLRAQVARGAQELIDERRRHRQRVRDVVEAVLGAVDGQQRRGIDLEREQIANRVRVLGAIHAMRRHVAGRRARAPRHRASPRARRRTHRSPHRSGFRPASLGGGIMRPRSLRTARSNVSACAATSSGDERVERDVGREIGLVVALDAIALDERPLLVGLRAQVARGDGAPPQPASAAAAHAAANARLSDVAQPRVMRVPQMAPGALRTRASRTASDRRTARRTRPSASRPTPRRRRTP